uniref:Uncharacterized protein n=1 Tax=Yersinia enterocolitica TaxID=630 RepID=B0RKP3_YEREN|nr:hypothetical protein [Yersinia enterocolitica]
MVSAVLMFNVELPSNNKFPPSTACCAEMFMTASSLNVVDVPPVTAWLTLALNIALLLNICLLLPEIAPLLLPFRMLFPLKFWLPPDRVFSPLAFNILLSLKFCIPPVIVDLPLALNTALSCNFICPPIIA